MWFNRKKQPDKKLFTQADVALEVVAFDSRTQELLGIALQS